MQIDRHFPVSFTMENMSNRKKSYVGATRNVEEKKRRFLQAVGKIFRNKSHKSLGVNKVSSEAGISKSLLYRYFGNLRNLVELYSEEVDFWLTFEDLHSSSQTDKRQLFKQALSEQFKYVQASPEMQQLVLWELFEANYNTSTLLKKREKVVENHLLEMDGLLQSEVDFRAVLAILIAGMYHLGTFSSVQKVPFCGIDLSSEKGCDRILEAVTFLIDATADRSTSQNPIS